MTFDAFPKEVSAGCPTSPRQVLRPDRTGLCSVADHQGPGSHTRQLPLSGGGEVRTQHAMASQEERAGVCGQWSHQGGAGGGSEDIG